MNHQRVDLIGTTARELLTRPGFAGRVLAVVSNAVYVIASEAKQSPTRELEIASSQKPLLAMTQPNEILWLAQNNLPMQARALCGDFDLSALRVGMSFRSDGTCLHFGETVETLHATSLQFAGARVWQPATIDPARVARGCVCAGERIRPDGCWKTGQIFRGRTRADRLGRRTHAIGR